MCAPNSRFPRCIKSEPSGASSRTPRRGKVGSASAAQVGHPDRWHSLRSLFPPVLLFAGFPSRHVPLGKAQSGHQPMKHRQDPNHNRRRWSFRTGCRAARTVLTSVPLFSAVSILSSPAGDNWPELRRPERNGHAAAAKPPLSWSETNHVVWKTPIYDLGWSSPVVWEKQIWLTTAKVMLPTRMWPGKWSKTCPPRPRSC